MSTLFHRLAAATLFTCVAALPAQATVVTFTAGGTIYGGADPLNLFHAGMDLTGKTYTETLTMDTAILDVREISPGFNSRLTSWGPITFCGTMTVDGQSYSWETVSGNGEAAMWNSTARRNWPLNMMVVGGNGVNTLDGNTVMAMGDYSHDTVPFLTSVDFAQYRHVDGLTGYDAHTGFTLTAQNGAATQFWAYPEWVTWQGVNPVPEPAMPALFLLGLFAAAAGRRIKMKRSAHGQSSIHCTPNRSVSLP